jgi:hypothetical protein
VPHEHTLTNVELAEAEAASDVIDLEGAAQLGTASTPHPEPTAMPAPVTETELAHAECESDLSHAEPAR